MKKRGASGLSSKHGPKIIESLMFFAVIVLMEYLANRFLPKDLRGTTSYFTLRISQLVFIWLALKIRKHSITDLALKPKDYPRGIFIGLCICLFFGLVVALAEFALTKAGFGSFLTKVAAKPLDAGFWATLTAAVLFGPIFEELVFRGLLYRGFRSRFGVALSIIMGTALFAVAHITSSGQIPWVQAVGGVAFCLALELSGSLVAPIIVHIAGNAAIFFLAKIMASAISGG